MLRYGHRSSAWSLYMDLHWEMEYGTLPLGTKLLETTAVFCLQATTSHVLSCHGESGRARRFGLGMSLSQAILAHTSRLCGC